MIDQEWTFTTDRTIAAARTGQLWLSATGTRGITDAMWREYLALATTSVATHGPFVGLFLYYPTSAPSSAQRRMLAEEYGTRVGLSAQKRVAVISDSAISRGAMTAISWLTSGSVALRAFPPSNDEMSQALDWLGEVCDFDRQRAETFAMGAAAVMDTGAVA